MKFNDNIPSLSVGTQRYLVEFYFAISAGLDVAAARNEARSRCDSTAPDPIKEAAYFQIADRENDRAPSNDR